MLEKQKIYKSKVFAIEIFSVYLPTKGINGSE